ncbi:hypothetical protein ACWOFR_11210 [Carnobacterium gallinarum]|uniref:hypothetical protein n=1 Tax=Carnobacterium gallinarum TaxID=2749 RepID=UPI00054FBAAE|nr:hypothetical protein [Carnobacterium gallinarum]
MLDKIRDFQELFRRMDENSRESTFDWRTLFVINFTFWSFFTGLSGAIIMIKVMTGSEKESILNGLLLIGITSIAVFLIWFLRRSRFLEEKYKNFPDGVNKRPSILKELAILCGGCSLIFLCFWVILQLN